MGFLDSLKKMFRGGGQQTAPLGNDLPEQGGITGTMRHPSAPVLRIAPTANIGDDEEAQAAAAKTLSPAPIAPVAAAPPIASAPVYQGGPAASNPNMAPFGNSPNPFANPVQVNPPAGMNPFASPAPVASAEIAPIVNAPTEEQRYLSPQMQALDREIERRENKDYSIKKDAEGNIIHRGADRDDDHNILDVLKTAGLRAVDGLARTGSLSGTAMSAVGGAVEGVADRNADEKIFNNYALNRDRDKYADMFTREKANKDWIFNQRARQAQIDTIKNDDDRQAEAVRNQKDYNDARINESQANRTSKEKDAKMRTVSQMLAKLPNYDPADERFGEITKTLGELGLPLAPKDVKKQVKLIQDADTGAWTLSLTNPITGEQEVRPVNDKDGKQLMTTSTAKVMSNAADNRQTRDQAFQLKKQQIANQLQLKLADYKTLNDRIDKETDFNRKAELQNQRIEAAKKLAELRDQLANDED